MSNGTRQVMAHRRLLRAIGRAVTAHHVGRGVSEQVLDIELASIVRDRPGREGVAEAVGVHLWHAGPQAEAAQHLLEAIRPERDARLESPEMARREEERAVGPQNGIRVARSE